MPLYEYQCAKCGQFELIQKFSDEPLRTCPTCGGEVHKMLSAPAIQFKGTGWYITDYARKGGGEKKSGQDAAAGSTSSGDSSRKSEGGAKSDSGKSDSAKGDSASKSGSGKSDPA